MWTINTLKIWTQTKKTQKISDQFWIFFFLFSFDSQKNISSLLFHSDFSYAVQVLRVYVYECGCVCVNVCVCVCECKCMYAVFSPQTVCVSDVGKPTKFLPPHEKYSKKNLLLFWRCIQWTEILMFITLYMYIVFFFFVLPMSGLYVFKHIIIIVGK